MRPLPRLFFTSVLSLTALTGCSIHFGDFPQESGADAEQLINDQLVTRLRVEFPTAKISTSSCPSTMDLSDGHVGYCAIPVDHLRYSIRVWFDAKSGQVHVQGIGTLFSMSTVEHYVQTTLMEYVMGISIPAVNCGKPRIRVYSTGARFSCFLGGRYKGLRVWLKDLNDGGALFVYRPKQIPESPEQLEWDRFLAMHKRGEATLVPGIFLERDMRRALQTSSALQAKSSEGLKPPTYGSVTCPNIVDLSGTRHGRCLEEMNGVPVRVDVWIDNTGSWNESNLDYAYYLPQIRQLAERYYTKLLLSAGFMRAVTVDCGAQRLVVVTPPATRKCSISVTNEKKEQMDIRFEKGGTFKFYVYAH